MSNHSKSELIAAVGQRIQSFQDATDEMDEAVAGRLGLNRTDLRCLSVVSQAGPMTPSALADATGLTRAAMTTALDRLERAGYLRRVRDQQDRRSVRVELAKDAVKRRAGVVRTDRRRRRAHAAEVHRGGTVGGAENPGRGFEDAARSREAHPRDGSKARGVEVVMRAQDPECQPATGLVCWIRRDDGHRVGLTSEMRYYMRTRLFLIGFSLLAAVAWAQQPQAWTPDTIHWQEINPDGTEYSVLQGRRDVPGEAFTYAFYAPAGYWEDHWHSADARVVVVKGELQLAYGSALDKAHAKGYGVGAYVLVPKTSSTRWARRWIPSLLARRSARGPRTATAITSSRA